MALSLTITDNADGTGGVATVAGSTVGSTNTVYYSLFTGVMGAIAWTSLGTRTGDGTISIASPSPVPLGAYLWRLDSVSGGTQTEANAYQNLTNATTKAVYDRVMDYVVSTITALNLSGSPTITKMWKPKYIPNVTPMPQIQVVQFASENFPQTMTNRDDIGYPVGIVFLDSGNQDFTGTISRTLLWRQQVRRCFIGQRMNTVAESVRNLEEPGQILNPAAFDKNILFSFLLFREICREQRGFGQ